MPPRENRLRSLVLPAMFSILSIVATDAIALDDVNQTWRGIAIEGYDTVAYFTEGKPVKGSHEFEHEWNGATWRFASEEHRANFAGDPGRYAPRFGGYCAWAVSQNSTAGIDPSSWKIVDGKLYLNYSAKIQKRWAEDIPGNIAKAETNWPGLRGD